ncbi:putative DNA-directed RNA polymerase III subunit RPC4 [Quillaja saponaria]|uniref:DNA-directed RNA polymerase III subunit RPC4 n=1 Tax=Quillaja saponaria TaxID=32244 RepID=A0AAD7LDX8_QUISA|nr:putative DNA-directed RNA polymerase III subunit RPC4 [Quillaja saponaria]
MEGSTAAPRKMRFAPKAPPRRPPKPVVKTKVKEDVDADAVQARDLLRRFNESAMKELSFGFSSTCPILVSDLCADICSFIISPYHEMHYKSSSKVGVEKFNISSFLFMEPSNSGTMPPRVAPSQIDFGVGGVSNSIKSYGIPKGGSSSSSYQNSNFNGAREQEYKEPWDYYSYYPVSLPIRRPYSGNPELLDEEEFGEAQSIGYDENSIKSATELGLMEENTEPSMFLLKLPPTMPMTKRPATANGKDTSDSTKPPRAAQAVEKPCNLKDLPAGFMGKRLVYKSGAVKLKLGDTLYDVSPGMNCVFAQDVVAINTAEKNCSVVGELNKHAIVIPDVDSILDGVADL